MPRTRCAVAGLVTNGADPSTGIVRIITNTISTVTISTNTIITRAVRCPMRGVRADYSCGSDDIMMIHLSPGEIAIARTLISRVVTLGAAPTDFQLVQNWMVG